MPTVKIFPVKILTTTGALLGVSCDSRQGPFLGDSAVLKSRQTMAKKGEKATLFIYFRQRQRYI